ncbi:MAG: hypothetical protein HC817_15490 [Saprospiraceae bacterium]|nr:hypothetical protein [Saprospiraceae bacterium]
MKINYLHLIAFDIPYPADYGGVIDVFYKIQALSAANVRVTVHCWQYGNRQPQLTLESVCEKVFYYPRREDPLSIFKSFWQKNPLSSVRGKIRRCSKTFCKMMHPFFLKVCTRAISLRTRLWQTD